MEIPHGTMKDNLPNFTGKTLSVVLTGEDTSRVIVNPRFELQAGRVFSIGTSPPGASRRDWMAGLDEALAWDRVDTYVVFASAEDYFTRLKTCGARRKKSNEP